MEKDNTFCQCKSEIKYLEAGILGIPTIASPTSAFKYAIKHMENGLLAGDTKEWSECLELLICNEEERKRIGENARLHVEAYYNPSYRGGQLVNILQQIEAEAHHKSNGVIPSE